MSDPHYNHKGIVKGTSNWESKDNCRNFNTLEEHDTALVNNINNVVKENDILICLGDWSFGSYKNGDYLVNIARFRHRIKCNNVHLILGNHDDEIKYNKLINVTEFFGDKIEETLVRAARTKAHKIMDYSKFRDWAVIPNFSPSDKGRGLYINAQDLFNSVKSYDEVKVVLPNDIKGKKAKRMTLILSHYAMRVWRGSHQGSIMLHGHSHGNLQNPKDQSISTKFVSNFYNDKKTMDVGIDTHSEFRPYNIREIIDIVENKETLLNIDHHGENTN